MAVGSADLAPNVCLAKERFYLPEPFGHVFEQFLSHPLPGPFHSMAKKGPDKEATTVDRQTQTVHGPRSQTVTDQALRETQTLSVTQDF